MTVVHSGMIEGVEVETGDVICTRNGGDALISGQYWWLIGKILPGDVDHIAVYIGPGGRFVEAGPNGVGVFEMPAGRWSSADLTKARGFVDQFYGVAYPLRDAGFDEGRLLEIRAGVADYCLEQARMGRPYNLDFFDPDRDDRFYCSQLAYKAYLRYGIDLNSGAYSPTVPGSGRAVYPQEIWDSCPHASASDVLSSSQS